jgi:cytochrome c-type protein NapC
MKNAEEMNEPQRGWFHRIRHPKITASVVLLLFVGAVMGLVFGDGFNLMVEHTNSQEFCTSCHTMQVNLDELEKTIHYSNRTGVRTTCPDCHVPKNFLAKMYRKMEAAQDVWGQIVGSIDTPAKFEAKRMEMAEGEWKRFKKWDSSPCRVCHNYDAMSAEKQGPTRYKKHVEAKANGQTCIDCHKGIAHKLPKEYHDPDEEE